MKKLTLAVLAVFCVASAGFAGNWGLGLKLGAGQNDPKSLKDTLDAYGGELDKNYGFFTIEGQYEWPMTETGKLGFRFGIEGYGDNEYKATGGKVTESTFAIPLTVYYRWDKGVKAFSWYAGGGLTYINTEVEFKDTLGSDKDHKSKFFPHIVAGGEYRFSQLFALGLEGRYNIGAKVKKNGYETDRSGFGAALVGRFYF
jgi:hypothetical protein